MYKAPSNNELSNVTPAQQDFKSNEDFSPQRCSTSNNNKNRSRIRGRHDSDEIVAKETVSNDDVHNHIELGPYDILCGRCSTAFNNVGNKRFRVTISLFLQRYIDAPTRQDKSIVIYAVMNTLEETGARFIKRKKGGKFVVLEEKQVRDKIGHALRDMAVAKLESGTAQVSAPTSTSSSSSKAEIFEPVLPWFSKPDEDVPKDCQAECEEKIAETGVARAPEENDVVQFSDDTLEGLLILCSDDDDSSTEPLPL